ncbi:putative inorganic phosphate cotransporter [Armadillidium nasatum]|uniref:Putative inorganic phosphate cotransporter n=1 Tax=Armadillidium nasatum TaxID=96803 RepID=A0A5N5T0D9_9CRUS|nr:putative inorganic phosphate cotransporter [Armadillidium nasatum]
MLRNSLWGARHTLAVMLFFALSCNYALRVNLSVAIVAMVNYTTSSTDNTSTSDQCPYPEDKVTADDHNGWRIAGYYWDEPTQGLVLGSYFWGYFLSNIPGGVLGDYFGGKLVIGIGVTFAGILTLISPWAAGVSSILFIFIRFLEGLAAGVYFPAANSIISKWYPKKERSKFCSFFFSGLQFGTFISMTLSGYLCSTDFLGGWPSAFYVIGFLTVIWGVLWFILIKDNPQDHPRISKEELRYITDGCPILKLREVKLILKGRHLTYKETVPIPIKEIAKSKAFWATAISNVGETWGLYTLLNETPKYFDSILHIKIKNNGLYTAAPYLGGLIFSNVFGFIMDILLKKKILTLVQVRRWAMTTGVTSPLNGRFALPEDLNAVETHYGPMLCLIGMCFVNCNSPAAITILFIAITLNGAVYCGYMCSHIDISPRFSAPLMGITNTLGTIPGFVTPVVVGAIINDNNTIAAWRIVFIIAAVVYFFTNLFYIIFITTDVQPWNDPVVHDSETESKIDSKSNQNPKAQVNTSEE